MKKQPKMPTVTTVLRPWEDWSRVDPNTLEAAADRGKAVHALCAAYALRLWIPEVPEECRGYFESFRRWYDAMVVETVAVEERLVSEVHGYTGQPDFLGMLRGDSGLSLVDWKTALPHSKSWRIQLSAYWGLAEENGYSIKRIMSLRLHRNGGDAKLKEYSWTIESDYGVFLNGLTFYKFMRG